jgi:guanylate kinase
MKGKLVIVCAPSGSGKTTIVRAVLPKIPQLEFSVSACSRAPREGETDGKDYYFLSATEFQNKINDEEFLEWEEVYPGSYYGTLRSEVDRIWSANKDVIFDVDVVGGLHIKKQFPDNSLALFILPPSIEELEKRLINRGTESPESLASRISKAQFELELARNFDVSIINDNLDKAIQETYFVISAFLES